MCDFDVEKVLEDHAARIDALEATIADQEATIEELRYAGPATVSRPVTFGEDYYDGLDGWDAP